MLDGLVNRPWSCELANEIVRRGIWIKDLISLPFEFFKRIVGSERRECMKEMQILPSKCRSSPRNVARRKQGVICKYLSCQKLSREVCIEAVQNQLMPLRLILEALLVQQLNTQQALKELLRVLVHQRCRVLRKLIEL
ncbi:hypothetical protein SAY87_020270 [Trapa incisa]|uniref:NPH3 domain-containing protein n=1 Tax=Trapa incisa TaxID=236973 RepID=A0AAN7K5S3_9MYRT|nr:hypothetical protein SAY87_020270 [Trapa incisa]